LDSERGIVSIKTSDINPLASKNQEDLGGILRKEEEPKEEKEEKEGSPGFSRDPKCIDYVL